MTRWLQAAKAGEWRTDTLTELTKPNSGRIANVEAQSERGFCQYRQAVSMAPAQSGADASAEVLSVLSVRQYGSSAMSPAVSAAVVLAFEDYAATDDPRDPRAWT